MAKRKRSPNRGRIRKSRAGTIPRSGARQEATKPERDRSNGTDQRIKGGNADKPQPEWVAVEHRDADGNRMFPREVIASTYLRRYEEVPDGTEIKVLVLEGYKPKDLMLVERKIYEIHRLSVHGWRRSGQMAVEVEGWRQHEADWFNAMRGVRLEIPNPNLPHSQHQQSDYIVSGTDFHRKMVTVLGENGGKTKLQVYEGTLDITETWKSAWRRQAAEVLNAGSKYFLLPLVSALVASLAVWWIVRPPDSDDHDLATSGNPEEQRVQAGKDGSAPQPADDASHDPVPKVSPTETDIDVRGSTGNVPNVEFVTAVPADDEVERESESDTNAGDRGVEGHTPKSPNAAETKREQVFVEKSADND